MMAFALGSVVVLVGAQLAGYELSVVTEDLASYRSLTQAAGLYRSYLHRDGGTQQHNHCVFSYKTTCIHITNNT